MQDHKNAVIKKYSSFSLCILLKLGLLSHMPESLAQTCASESEIPSSTPTSNFTDHGNGTVTHHSTNLMWMKCPLGQSGEDCTTISANTYTWKEALETAHKISFAVYDDWRVPNIKELRSIVEERCSYPAINTNVFPTTSPDHMFWSSTPDHFQDDNDPNSFGVRFDVGETGVANRQANYIFVRLVRDNQ